MRDWRRFFRLSKVGVCRWTLAMFTLTCMGLYLYLHTSMPDKMVTERPLTTPIIKIQPGVLDIEVAVEPCREFTNVQGQEEIQLNVAWSWVFGYKTVRPVTEIIMDFEDSWLKSLPIMHTLLSKHSLVLRPDVDEFHHQLEPLVYNGTHMCVRINETRNGVRTKGGSNFQLTIRGAATIDVARSIDNFDGAYCVCARYYSLHHSVFLVLHYTQYEAYLHQEGTKLDNSRLLISSNIIVSPKDKRTILTYLPYKTNMTFASNATEWEIIGKKHAFSSLPQDPKQLALINTETANLKQRYVHSHEVCHVLDEGQWVVYQGQWRLKYRKHIVASPHPERLRQCLNEYDSIQLVGDSHLRLTYYYLLTYVTGPFEEWALKEHLDLKCSNYLFWWRPKGREFLEYLEKLRSDLLDGTWIAQNYAKKGKRGHIMVMGVGHHDIQKWDGVLTGAGLYFRNMRRVLRALADIRESAKAQNIKLLWVTHPLIQWNYTVTFSGRNNYQLAAMNQWLVPKILQLGIPVFNLFDLTFILYDQDVCFGHYLCVLPSKHKPDGAVGQAMADLLLTYMCPPL